MRQIDERDTMFARASYKEDSVSYEEYYTRHPERKEGDDAIRQKPQLCGEGTATYDPLIGPMAGAAFHFLSDIRKFSEGEVSGTKVEVDPELMTKRIKGYAKHYGACLVGVTPLKTEHLYSHQGRHEEDYGKEVQSGHTYAIAFAVQMEKDMVNRAPMISEIVETSRAYVEVGIVGMVLAYYIRSLGYEARNHMDAHYLVNAVAVAKDAGLGEVGRNNMLTNKDYGSMIRLGVVTTTLPLVVDEPVTFGLADFCKVCNQCGKNCFSKSLSTHEEEATWKTNQEACYSKWRDVGTDCGMCLTSCPFSQELASIQEIEHFKDNHTAIKKVLDEYKERFGNRAFIKGRPEWLE
ncbi:MAG: hypothetical protein ACRDDX_00010 [Cellulosilyticaceae bacterium]